MKSTRAFVPRYPAVGGGRPECLAAPAPDGEYAALVRASAPVVATAQPNRWSAGAHGSVRASRLSREFRLARASVVARMALTASVHPYSLLPSQNHWLGARVQASFLARLSARSPGCRRGSSSSNNISLARAHRRQHGTHPRILSDPAGQDGRSVAAAFVCQRARGFSLQSDVS